MLLGKGLQTLEWEILWKYGESIKVSHIYVECGKACDFISVGGIFPAIKGTHFEIVSLLGTDSL
jgi:hypothetical protein